MAPIARAMRLAKAIATRISGFLSSIRASQEPSGIDRHPGIARASASCETSPRRSSWHRGTVELENTLCQIHPDNRILHPAVLSVRVALNTTTLALCDAVWGGWQPSHLIGLDWAVPDFSTLSRRQKTLKVNIPYRGSDGPLHLLVDSTGIKFLGDGEWQARKHGGAKRVRHCA